MELLDHVNKGSGGALNDSTSSFAILLAGWVPSILTLVVSYTILSKTLESKILTDRQTLVQLIGHLVGDDLARTGGIIDYYQNSPEAPSFCRALPIRRQRNSGYRRRFIPIPRIDGMFLTSADGQLVRLRSA